MQRIALVSLVLFILCACAVARAAEPAADEPPNPFGLPGEWREILTQEPVRKELRLSTQQAVRLAPVLDDAKLAPEEARKRIGEALDAEQTARLKELSRQISGWFAVFEPDVFSALAVTSEQEAKLCEITRKRYAEMKDFLRRARFRSREAMQKYVAECRDETGQLLRAVLTAAQQKKLADLQSRSIASAPK
jgi:hypothetical protein